MARVNVNTIRMTADAWATDAAEASTAIDAGNGMRVIVSAKARYTVFRITNTHGSPHAVTIKANPGSGNSKGVYGAAGPGGSSPTEPDYVTTAIPATTGVRFLAPSGRFFRSDGSFWLDFEAAHTGTITAIELS